MSTSLFCHGAKTNLQSNLCLILRSRRANLRGLSESLDLKPRRTLFAGPPLLSEGHWKRETPAGSLTELYVYKPESRTVWPDPELGVFSHVDPRFNLPGNVGLAHLESTAEASSSSSSSTLAHRSDLLTRPTNAENQAQVLYTANDYIQHMTEAEGFVCANVLEAFPTLPGMSNFCCEVHEAPRLLRREVRELFADRDVMGGSLSVITLAQRTESDMSAWSERMEEEREEMTGQFVIAAKEICARLKSEGHWSDFIDPSSGTPYFGAHSSTTMFETDEKYRLLGFRIEDLGCCKVISHREFGRNVFVGTIFTDAHVSTGAVEEIFCELKMTLGRIDGEENKS